jgi:hypothetical protein
MFLAALLTVAAHANPVDLGVFVDGSWDAEGLLIYAALLVPSALIEALIVWAALPAFGARAVFGTVFLVHLVSYPLTVLFFHLIGPMAEVIPIFLEAGCYLAIFRRVAHRVDRPIAPTRARCLVMSAEANFITFILGAVIVLPFASDSAHAPSHARSDLRALATAIQAYAADHGAYPPRLESVTTPQPYLSTLWLDLYMPAESQAAYRYLSFGSPNDARGGFLCSSLGPDGDLDITSSLVSALLASSESEGIRIDLLLMPRAFDPTNGTRSDGDIFRLSGPIAPLRPR